MKRTTRVRRIPHYTEFCHWLRTFCFILFHLHQAVLLFRLLSIFLFHSDSHIHSDGLVSPLVNEITLELDLD